MKPAKCLRGWTENDFDIGGETGIFDVLTGDLPMENVNLKALAITDTFVPVRTSPRFPAL